MVIFTEVALSLHMEWYAKNYCCCTANPNNVISQAVIVEFARDLFGVRDSELFNHLLPVFENAMVKERYLAVDFNWLKRKHPFGETNDFYIESALNLSEKVALEVSQKSGIGTQDFNIIFFLSTTGLSTPSIDARLFNRIALDPHIKRVPIWGLGCAAGAGGLARAHDYLKAFPTHRALIIGVEICSLASQLGDPKEVDIISAALFGDGAAGCVMVGDDVPRTNFDFPQPEILETLSTIYPETLDVMSWRVTGDGFRVQLSKDIPSIVTSEVRNKISDLLSKAEIPFEKVTHLIFHPGGARVLKAYAEGLGISKQNNCLPLSSSEVDHCRA